MNKHLKYLFVPLSLMYMLIAASCSNTKYLAEGESLYEGAKINIVDTAASKENRKALKKQLEESIRPKPNSALFGLKFKLTIYNLAGEPKKEKGIRYWLRSKVGEEPVLASDVNLDGNTKVLVNQMQNQGYFSTIINATKETENQRTKAIFDVTTGPQTKIRNVIYEKSDTSELAKDVADRESTSILKSGDPYNFDAIKDERIRIDNVLKNKGYYYFNPDFILMDADTGAGKNEVDIIVKMKYNEMPSNAYKKFTINDVTILSNYRLNNRNSKNNNSRDSIAGRVRDTSIFRRPPRAEDTLHYDNFQVVDRQRLYKPSVFYQAMQLDKGELYNKRDQNIALNRLVTLGAFKFVKNEFSQVRDSSLNLLDVTYLLTPYARKGFNLDFGGFTQNDSRGGLRGTLTWKNRNFLRGAELLTIKLTGGFEAQYGGFSERPNSYNVGLETNLNIPRFVVPFFTIKPSGMYIPRTIISAAYNYSLRAGMYQINSFNLGFGYNWKEDARKDHKFYPFNITLVKTDTFDNSKSAQFNLSNLIFNGIIFGPTYEYTYNSQLGGGTKRRSNFYFSGLADLSGNIVGLAQGTSVEQEPKKIFGSNYAQYLKAQLDFRHYFQLTPGSVIASRAMVGYGYSYGNSSRLPNVKQFFSGGSSSLRGFASRLVGPGTYNARYLNDTNATFEILGDIKAELNLEYRAKLYRFIEGAVFFDAGNIWLQRENTDFPGGKISSNFYKELAVNTGVGVRFDFSILLVRFDFAFPIRKPWFPEGERWRFNDLQFGTPEWRQENLFFNLAIGYPF